MLERAVRRLAVIAAVCVGASALAMYWLISHPNQGGVIQDYRSYALALQTIGSTSIVPSIASGVGAALLALQAHRMRWLCLLVISVVVAGYEGTLSYLIQLALVPRDTGASYAQYNGLFQALYFFVFPALPVVAALAYTFRYRERRETRHAPALTAGDDSFELTISAIDKQA